MGLLSKVSIIRTDVLAIIRKPVDAMFTWTKRNEDKPLRCPRCRVIAARDLDRYGPRTILRCLRGCAVQWRIGVRAKPW